MGYNTEHTEWPSFTINEAVKNLVSDFFHLLDSEDAHVGDKLADDIFASNGQAQFGGHMLVGRDGISLPGSRISVIESLMMCSQRSANQETMPGKK
jgi:hypothetical protein